jgi:hypothetical protein
MLKSNQNSDNSRCSRAGTRTCTTFKMYGGQVYAVSAILSKVESTGWD